MIVTRCWCLSCVAVLALAAAGCFAGASDSPDPPVQTVDAAGGAAPSKPSPDLYWVKLETTKGDVVIEVHRNWSPNGADRFYELVQNGFFDGCRLFRVIEGFVVQTGIAADPAVNAKWNHRNIPDDHYRNKDPNRQSNKRGYVTFAKSGLPNSRTTQFFINCAHNAQLDEMGFTPFGKVLGDMATVDSFYGGYQEEPQKSSERIEAEGNAYLDKAFPQLDSIKKATLLPKKPELPKQPAG
ncbi:MAG TPA: peptidylprolyl isomerase [Planctomycetaceae bacterium]|jgi:peptidyl-prolyl cis-trans isomerase A (cyclophilin A)|nr:peptidylprolyl isomerase [Planctomycetaceae bacterium]